MNTFYLGGKGWASVPTSKDRDRRAGAFTLGSYIRKLRTEQGFSLRYLVKKTGISASSLCRLEKGDYVPCIQMNVEALDKLWGALGGDMNQMLYLSRKCPVCNGMGTLKDWSK